MAETAMIRVDTWDDLLQNGLKCALDEIDPAQLIIDENLVFTVRVKGESWGGAIDYRGANYVIELQRAVNRIYKELSEAEVPSRNLSKLITVKVRIVEGSSIFEINLGKALITILENLSGKQKVAVIGMAMFCVTGYWVSNRVFDYKQNIIHDQTVLALAEKQGKTTGEIVEKVISLTNRALDVIEKTDVEKPSRQMVYSVNGFKSASITGVGEGREESKKIQELFELWD